jgi:hypothetical protein
MPKKGFKKLQETRDLMRRISTENWKNKEIREKRIKGLHLVMKKAPIKIEPIKCACSCNKILNKYDKKNRERMYLRGHNNTKYKDEKDYKPYNNKSGYITRGHYYEHRLLIEKHINRKLTGTELVHHIDGDRSNNNLSNLMLLPNEKVHKAIHKTLRKFYGNQYVRK